MQHTEKKLNQNPQLARQHRAFFVGLFLAIPGVTIPLLLTFTIMKTEFVQGWYYYHVIYENSYGLTRGNQVVISGMPIGHVNKITLEQEGRIAVLIKIREKYGHLVKKDTRAQLKQKNFVVGDWVLELTGGSAHAADDGDTLTGELPVRLDKTIDQITGMVTALEQSIQYVLSGHGTVGRLVTEDSLYRSLLAIGHNTNALAVESKYMIKTTDRVVDNIGALSQGGVSFIDSLHSVTRKITSALDGVDSILNNVQAASSVLPSTMHQIRKDFADAEDMMNTIQNSWIMKRFAGKGEDPLLIKNP